MPLYHNQNKSYSSKKEKPYCKLNFKSNQITKRKHLCSNCIKKVQNSVHINIIPLASKTIYTLNEIKMAIMSLREESNYSESICKLWDDIKSTINPYCIIFGAFSYKIGSLYCTPWNENVYKILCKLPWDDLLDQNDEEVKTCNKSYTKDQFLLLKGSNKEIGDSNEHDFMLLRNNFKDSDDYIPDLKELKSLSELQLPSNYMDVLDLDIPTNTDYQINLTRDYDRKHYSDIRENHLLSDFIQWYIRESQDMEY